MTMMSHREDNMARWSGVRPAHRGTQIAKSLNNVVNTTSTLHTVTAGKVLYLCSWSLQTYGAAAPWELALLVRDTGDVLQYEICRISINTANSSRGSAGQFWPPLEIPAGYDVCVWDSTAASWSHGFIFGWEE